jgi:hypothetical protein
MPNDYSQARSDAALNPAAIALPAGASTTVNGASVDLNAVTPFHADVEFELVSASATLDSTALPNGETITYTLQESTDDSTFTALYVLSEATMTGAGGAGDTANTVYFRLPSDVSRYIRISAVTSGSSGDCSAATMQLKALF